MDTDPDTIDTLNDPVNQPRGVLEFGTRITAGGKSGSHEGPAVIVLAHDDLSQNRFIELHKSSTRVTQLD